MHNYIVDIGVSLFQSRNRDAFRFKSPRQASGFDSPVLFQSRNRDAFRFKLLTNNSVAILYIVSISESRCFSFQATVELTFAIVVTAVSISGSRCFSFQVLMRRVSFEGDPSRFNLGIEMLFVSSPRHERPTNTTFIFVSISESRCFSFQVPTNLTRLLH